MKEKIDEIIKKTSQDDIDLIREIVYRAIHLEITDDYSMMMLDLLVAHDKFNIQLENLLFAKNYEFYHDVLGVKNNIDRETCEFKEVFVPYFASA